MEETAMRLNEILKEYNVVLPPTYIGNVNPRLAEAKRVVDEIREAVTGPFGPEMSGEEMLAWIEKNI